MQIIKVIKNWFWKASDDAGNETKGAWQDSRSSVSNIGIKSQKGGSWFKKSLPLLLILAIGIWAVWHFTGHNPLSAIWSNTDSSVQTLEANAGSVIEPTSEVANSTIESEIASWIKISLPNGENVEFEEGSFGHNLTTWLASEDAGIKIFTWDNLKFPNGSAELQEESAEQLTKIALVLNEYSWEQILIEAHSDYIGNAASNKLLTQQRADSAKEWFVTYANIDATAIEAQGWGSEKWTASSDMPEEGMSSGRIDFVITKK